MAGFLFLGRFSVVYWPGDWRLLWFQPCGYEFQIVRAHIRSHDIRAYNRVIGSLSDDGLYLQFIVGLMLYRMDCMYSPIVKYVLAIWSYMYIMDLRTLYFVYIAHPYGVTGPCLTAPVWQFSLPRNATWLLYQDLSLIAAPLKILFSLRSTLTPFGRSLACMDIWTTLYDNVFNILAK